MLLRRFFLLARCVLMSSVAYFSVLASAHAQATAGYTVKPGDTLEISVWKEPDLQRTVLVRPDGIVGWRSPDGFTADELTHALDSILAR